MVFYLFVKYLFCLFAYLLVLFVSCLFVPKYFAWYLPLYWYILLIMCINATKNIMKTSSLWYLLGYKTYALVYDTRFGKKLTKIAQEGGKNRSGGGGEIYEQIFRNFFLNFVKFFFPKKSCPPPPRPKSCICAWYLLVVCFSSIN